MANHTATPSAGVISITQSGSTTTINSGSWVTVTDELGRIVQLQLSTSVVATQLMINPTSNIPLAMRNDINVNTNW